MRCRKGPVMRCATCIGTKALALWAICTAPSWAKPLSCMERFRVKGFVIGAWWGPDPSEANYCASAATSARPDRLATLSLGGTQGVLVGLR